MKKLVLLFSLFIAFCIQWILAKVCIDRYGIYSENISSYETANQQLEAVSKKWQAEVETAQQEVQNMYKSYQSEQVFLSADQKTKKETEIVDKEKAAQELKRKYFGADGELFKRREALIKPIQDDVYNAVKEISDAKGYQLVLDRASASSVIFASPRIDISNEVLAKLGYSK